MTVLVTGASGFVGGHLVAALRAHLPSEIRLVACGHEEPSGERQLNGVEWRSLDLTDAEAVTSAIEEARPRRVFHLAALSSVQMAHGTARDTFEVNFGGTQNLARALRIHTPAAAVVFASTGEVYGSTFAAGEPVNEASPVHPLNPYSRSKLAAEIALQDTLSDVCPVIALRLLNHTGPGQDERFVIPAFAAQIARIERGLIPPRLSVGNLSAERDFLDVDDVIAAYLKALKLTEGASGYQVYNVASGRPRSIASILERLATFTEVRFELDCDPQRMRPADIARTVCDSSAFRQRTGWRPIREFDETLLGVLNWWRARMPD